MKKQRIAAIDIGSNSIKLAIVKAAASDSFKVVVQERERVRLGEETLRKKILSAAAIERSANAVARFCAIAEKKKAKTILAVATASVREAANAADFVREIEEKTGVRVKVLSSIEEARLIGVAAAQFFSVQTQSLLNIDIGGGSTELSLMRSQTPEKLFSMNIGAVGLTERFFSSNQPLPHAESELKNFIVEIKSALEIPAGELKREEKWHLTSGTSGTILNLAALLHFQGNKKKCGILLESLSALNKMLSRMSNVERSKLPGISPQRAEVIVAGGQILECVMRALEIESIVPCRFALREGVIIDFLRESEAGKSSLKDGET